MAEFMDVLGELKAIPEEVHLLCPRQHDDDHESYDEDLLEDAGGLSEEDKKRNLEIADLIRESTVRREKFLSCMQLLAFSSDEVEQQQQWIWQKLDDTLEKCDFCIKKYYYGKIWLMEQLGESYDESDVARFSKMLEECDIKRITRGLSRATETLRALPPEKRGLNALDRAALLSIFETLSSEAMLNDETLLSQYFGEPFKLIQTRRILKVPDYVPAATRFLFDTNEDRCIWATNAWSRFKKPPTIAEFDFAIKRHLLAALGAASCQPMQANAIQKLWYGLERIVATLDREQITHNLRALDIDACRLAVEHLSLPLPSLRHLLRTMALFLQKAPNDFWDAMQTISPQAVIEQVFSNSQFTAFFTVPDGKFENSPLKDMLLWISPLMSSLKTAHQPQACRFLVHQLLHEFQSDRFSFTDTVKYHCFRKGLDVLVYTLRCFTDHESSRGTVGRVVLSEVLEVVTKNIDSALEPPPFSVEGSREDISSLGLDVIRNALGLECQSLKSDYESLLHQKDTMQHGVSTCSNVIWDGVIKHLHEDNIFLSRAALLGILGLVGLEKFSGKAGVTPERTQFNLMYGHVTHLACQILERLADFKAEHLDDLFQRQDTNSALISALFSADLNTYQAAVNLIKNISGQSGRKEAISHLLISFPDVTLFGLSWSFRRISNMKTFASAPRMIKTGTDVLNVLCDSQVGILRTRNALTGSTKEAFSLKKLWEFQWQALTTIFEETDHWHQRGNDKNLMIEFCRDSIQFAELLFDQYSVFVSATQEKEQLIQSPTRTMTAMVKWLRLKDEYLKTTLVGIVGKLLRRLGELEVTTVSKEAISFIEAVAIDSSIKTMLTPQEKAELIRALEAYSGKSIAITSTAAKPNKQSRITSFTKTTSSPAKISDDEDEFADDIPDQVLMELSGSVELNKARLAAQAQAKAKAQAKAQAKAPTKSLAQREAEKALPTMPKPGKLQVKQPPAVNVETFREKREKEREAKKKRDQMELARLKKNLPVRGVGEHTAGQGSGLKGIGVKGKDHTAVDSMMVSSGSESESDSEDELDRELFGSGASKPDAVKAYEESRLQSLQQRGPIKKIKQVRSSKDMRARLAPDLSSLHRSLLSWDYFASGDLPPNSDRTDYSLVSNTFKDHIDYQRTFEPLLILEAWQGFQSSKEENNGNSKPFEIKVANRLSVDSFVEVSTVMQNPDVKDLGIGEADIILLSKSNRPTSDSNAPHCLARIHSFRRKKANVEVTYRINSGAPLISSINPGGTIFGVRITSLTPLEREYGALMALQYYDLCEEVIKAKPSPILNYTDHGLKSIVENYKVNLGQAKAVKSAIDNDAFTLIQGPPGSGKTKTIVALVGALLTRTLADKGVAIVRPSASGPPPPGKRAPAKKLLVCAPSNAAVDELVMRFKDGVKTLDGRSEKLSVIRLGRSEAINTNVVDVTLEELVNAKLGNSVRKDTNDELQTLYMDHKAASASFIEARDKMDQCRARGQPVPQELEKEFEMLKKKKIQLSQQIDDARDKNQAASRDADLSRRKAQQETLDGAHVICATLSGSGHDLFQNLSIEFETVIIDEAAQSIELSALIPLKYGCSKCILVGDPKQLPPTVLSKEASRFQYEQSLFVRMQANHPKDVHLLDVQYRMHPEISRFPSAAFYDGKLQDGPDMAKLRTRQWHQSSLLGPYRFYDVQGLHQSATKGHSLINVAEIRVAMKLYERLTTDYKHFNFSGKIGIITPYKGQLREMKQQFSLKYGNAIFSKVEFNTTDAFQGRESEVIIFSCVRASNRGIGFLSDIRRMNVGLTRAKSSLWVLGNSKSLVQGQFWNGLITDARKRDLYTEGDVVQMLNQPQLALNESYQDLEMTDAPAREATPPLPDHRASRLPDGPSGGRNGLNEMANCGYCGSHEHMTHNCDNLEAKRISQGTCKRCGEDAHNKSDCKAQRCRECGQFGHLAPVCKSTKVLSKQERDKIAREELHHVQMQERKLERQKKRQLGDHDPKPPVIQVSRKTPSPGPRKDKQSAHDNNHSGPNAYGKRKRDSLPPDNAPKGPRSKSRKSDQQHQRPPPPSDLVAPSKNGQAAKPINAGPQGNPDKGTSNQAAPIPHRPGPPERPNNGPRGPPPPRKKKPVDPFIRPKRK